MKKNVKKIVCAACAVTTTAAIALSAFAADYSSPVSYTPPVQADVVTANDISNQINDAVKTAVDDALADALASTTATSSDDDTSSETSDGSATEPVEEQKIVVSIPVEEQKVVLKPNALKVVAAQENVILELVSKKTTISIDSSTITEVKKLDLSMKVVNSSKKTKIRTKSKAEFGCEVKIAVTSCKMSPATLKKARVYCDGVDLGPVELNEDGVPVITVTKGGVYEIR